MRMVRTGANLLRTTPFADSPAQRTTFGGLESAAKLETGGSVAGLHDTSVGCQAVMQCHGHVDIVNWLDQSAKSRPVVTVKLACSFGDAASGTTVHRLLG